MILLEKDEVLGGNSGPNLGVGITGADRYNAYATETGIVHATHREGHSARVYQISVHEGDASPKDSAQIARMRRM